MKILSWNVNGLQAVNRLAAELQPDLICLQKVRSKGASPFIKPEGYFDWIGLMDDGLFGGVSTYIHRGFPFEFDAQRNDIPQWLVETACLNVIRFDQFILVNAYFPYANKSNEQFVKIRQRWDYELQEYLENSPIKNRLCFVET